MKTTRFPPARPLIMMAFTAMTSLGQSHWIPHNEGLTSYLTSVTWTGTQLVAVGEKVILTSTLDEVTAIVPRNKSGHALPLHFDQANLFANAPKYMVDPRIQIATYSVKGTSTKVPLKFPNRLFRFSANR